MRKLILFIVLIFSFECFCQTIISNVEIDYGEVFERKGLVYYKSDNSLVTGKVIQYNKKNVAQRYILIEKGKPYDLGWRIISDKAEQPKESALGTSIVLAAAIAGIYSVAAGNDISVPINDNLRKDKIIKVYKEMSQRNDIMETPTEIVKKSNDSLAIYDEKELISLNGNSIHEEKNGPWEEFFYTGELKCKGSYKNSLKEGIWEEYYENGQLKEKAIYKKGVKNGLWLKYYSNHQLLCKGQYQNGEMIGEWKYYDEDGNELFTENYGD